MRPQVLFSLFTPVTKLPGVGPRIAQALARVAGERVVDLLWHLPNGVVDRRYAPRLADAAADRVATLTVTVGAHNPPPPGRGRIPYRITCSDGTDTLTLVFFHAQGEYLEKVLPVGEQRVVSGRVEQYQSALQMTHPDHIVPVAEAESIMRVEPVYPLTAGLTPRGLGKAIQGALALAPDLDEWLDGPLKARHCWSDWKAALAEAHAPDSASALEPTSPARMRLAYDELLASQLALLLVRARQRQMPGRVTKGDGALRPKVLAALPFALTASQRKAIADIEADMAGESRMLRLLQGDVGSGKTLVALMAMLVAVEAGRQAAMMAPTEILARQHYATIKPLAQAAGLEVLLLTGRDKGKARAAALERLAVGQTALAVGTHALFQDDVAFKDLGLAVIDEQQRFGVHQRLTLAGKGRGTDILVITATPIPRTLMLAAYGDMDSSRLTEKPAGRLPIDTRVLPVERIDQVIEAVRRSMAKGGKVYWVCPLVEDSEISDLAAATERHRELAALLGDRVGLVHGRMKAKEKDAGMAAFAGDGTDLLVATTVIEVGVDVPAATVMVIEHAERFGLSQLHQLRGRIGRGSGKSTCLLLYAGPLGQTARARLEVMRETEDGFRIAEEDLRLRGGGELLGTRQSGLPEFRLADLAVHADLLAIARDDARLVLKRDAELETDRGKALRTLLYLFERDAVIRYLRSG